MLSSLLGILCLLEPVREYTRFELYDLVASAERVVSGTIVALQKETFDLTIERELSGGRVGAEPIRLRRFFDWDVRQSLGELPRRPAGRPLLERRSGHGRRRRG